MYNKEILRKKYFSLRKRNFFDINLSFFDPLIRLVKSEYKKRTISLSSYYPSSYEVDSLKIFESKVIKKLNILMPVVKEKNFMSFHKWKKNDVLKVNKYGMLEPAFISKPIIPNIMLVPLLAYDDNKNRLGYGGGFYDRYLNKYFSTHRDILTIGIAFSFQKYKKLPNNKSDVVLNYILTEKGLF